MKKCSTHPSDSGIGVCAFCLRERLSALAASPAGHPAASSSPESRRNPNRSSSPAKLPPPLRRLSPFSNAAGKFSLFPPIRNPRKAESKPSSGSNNPWLLALNLGRRRRNERASPPVSGRGMSPAAEMSPVRGVSIPSPMWRRRQQSPRRFSSFGLCLSPMVRPIPGNRPPPETAFSGEIRGAFNRRCGGGGGGGPVVREPSAGLMISRSRKLVDLGKDFIVGSMKTVLE